MAFHRTVFQKATASATKVSKKLPWNEIRLPCSDGTIIAGQRWHTASPDALPRRTVVCWHGWMDNCRSFYKLAPKLAAANYDVVALDLPGHGRSSHKSIDSPPTVAAELAYYVAEAIEALTERDDFASEQVQQGRVTLIGHSLGAATTALYTSAFPDRVDQLVLLDGGIYLAQEASEVSARVRNHIEKRMRSQKYSNPRKVYPSLKAAIETRIQSAEKMPGQSLSADAAREMVLRATHLDHEETASDKEVQFRHDARLVWPSIQYLTHEQSDAIMTTLQGTDCCLLLADKGWPFRTIQRAGELMKARVNLTLPGSHFFHADPDTSDAVANAVLDFLATSKSD